MNKYIIDTNIISYLADDLSPFHTAIVKKISQIDDYDRICLSILTIYELQHGIASMSHEMAVKFSETKKLMIKHFDILPLSEKGAEIFGMLKAEYIRQTGILKDAVKRHDIDLMVASSAMAENAVLVSNDRIFSRLKKMRSDFLLEDWTL